MYDSEKNERNSTYVDNRSRNWGILSSVLFIIVLILLFLMWRGSKKYESRVSESLGSIENKMDSLIARMDREKECKDSLLVLSNINNAEIARLATAVEKNNSQISGLENEVSGVKKTIDKVDAKIDSLERGINIKVDSIYNALDSIMKMIEKCCDTASIDTANAVVENFSVEVSKKTLSRSGKVKSNSSKLYSGDYSVSIIPGKGFSEFLKEKPFYNAQTSPENTELSVKLFLNEKEFDFSLIEEIASSKNILPLNKGNMLLEAGGLPNNLDWLGFNKSFQYIENPHKTLGIIQVCAGSVATIGGVAGTIHYAFNPELIFRARQGGEEVLRFDYGGFGIPFFAALAGLGVYEITQGVINIRGSLTEITISGSF